MFTPGQLVDMMRDAIEQTGGTMKPRSSLSDDERRAWDYFTRRVNRIAYPQAYVDADSEVSS